MQSHRPFGFTPVRAGLLLGALALAACSDRGGPIDAAPPVEELPQAQLAQVTCTGNLRARTVSCSQPGLSGDARGLVVGGQNQYVRVASSSPGYTAADSSFVFGVTVQNLIAQAMGTADGATASAAGVRVFFSSGPVATAGSGEIQVVGDGVETFTQANQPYYQYSGADLGADGILAPSETSSSRQWTLKIPQTVESFTFTLLIASDVRFPSGWVEVSPDSGQLVAGGTQGLAAVVKSAVGNVVSEEVTWGTSNAGVATVDGEGQVTTLAPGRVTITATAGARTGQATLQVCPDLAVGAAYTFGSADAAAVCAHGGASGAEYTLMPANMSSNSSMNLVATASNVTAAAGPPNPNVMPSGAGGLRLSTTAQLQPSDDFEDALRARERRDLEPIGAGGLIRRGGGRGGARFYITAGVPAVGDTMVLNSRSNSSCGTPTLKTGVVKVVANHVIVVADTGNPTAGGFTQADYEGLAAQFDTFIHPTVTSVIGTPADIDENGRVIAFYTEAVNQLSTPGSGSFIGGFVYARDLFSNSSCPGSNQGEMFYMLAADSLGENGNVFRASTIRTQTIGTLAHEYQHLINASRRMYVNTPWNSAFETSYMEEGLAHIMEELLFYRASGLTPRSNGTLRGNISTSQQITAWNNYSSSNFSRMRSFLARPDTTGPVQTDTDLSTRGAMWAFLRYASDRRGGDDNQTWYDLVNTGATGLTNLQTVFGANPHTWFRDWIAAMYADDAVTGIGAQHQNLSWNFRSFYAGAGTLGTTYPLGTRNLGDGTESFLVRSGSAAGYLRFAVPAGSFGRLALASVNTTPFALMQVTLMRTK
jgi:hypothetical protein